MMNPYFFPLLSLRQSERTYMNQHQPRKTTMIYPPEFKEKAVRMLLNQKRDAATISQLLGIPIRTLLDWQTDIRTHQADRYAQMVAESHSGQDEPDTELTRPVISYTQKLEEAEHRLRQLGNINRSLKLCILDLRAALLAHVANRSLYDTKRLLRCWQTLPATWRLAAAVHADVCTLEEISLMEPQISTAEVAHAAEQIGQTIVITPISQPAPSEETDETI